MNATKSFIFLTTTKKIIRKWSLFSFLILESYRIYNLESNRNRKNKKGWKRKKKKKQMIILLFGTRKKEQRFIIVLFCFWFEYPYFSILPNYSQRKIFHNTFFSFLINKTHYCTFSNIYLSCDQTLDNSK